MSVSSTSSPHPATSESLARALTDSDDLTAKYVMPIPDKQRRAEGAPCMVNDLDEFKKNWSIFTENSLSQLLDWNHVVAAGGSVQACLTPLPEEARTSKRMMRKYYHEAAYPSSDIDLFLWGMTPKQAEEKIKAICEAVRDSVPWDVTCVRTRHTLSIYSQYPYRCVQIVLRLYKSPAEILAGFDVDSPSCAFDGERVWANPRAIVAMMRQCNTVDMTRRSPSYEVRLAKYSTRDFEVYIPNLRRADVDPTIFERAITRIQGLARLLVLEKLANPDSRAQYLNLRSTLRGRPVVQDYMYGRRRHRGRRYNGDLKLDTPFSGLEMNDYDVVSLHIPYGPGWTAGRIEKLIYKTDLGINTPYNPKNKDRILHRHPAFFGSVEQCLEDCCEYCPEPRNEEEHQLQDEEDKSYVRGRIGFVEEDPGRQTMSGSFNPIDEGEWSEQAYVLAVTKFFGAISTGDRLAVSQIIQDGEDVNRRDFVGRTPLHFAILANRVDVACDLIDAGARMTARLAGGRSALHLAAQMDQATVVQKLLERSAANEEKQKEAQAKAEAEAAAAAVKASERPSSEDDWSSEDGEDENLKPTVSATPGGDDAQDAMEDNEDEPDILDISLADWDFAFTPLAYAIIAGSLEIVDIFLAAGADVNVPMWSKQSQGPALHALLLTHLTDNEDRGAQIAARLIAAGASSSTADDSLMTVFHRFVCSGKTKLLTSLLRYDPNAKIAIDYPAMSNHILVYPIVSAITNGDYASLAVLIAYGAKLTITEEDVSRMDDKWPPYQRYQVRSFMSKIFMPLEVALVRRDLVAHLLIKLGVDVNFVPQNLATSSPQQMQSILDWTTAAVALYDPDKVNTTTPAVKTETKCPISAPASDNWSDFKTYLASHELLSIHQPNMFSSEQAMLFGAAHTISSLMDPKILMSKVHEYLTETEALLIAHGAQKNIAQPDAKTGPANQATSLFGLMQTIVPSSSGYTRIASHSNEAIPVHLKVFYDELYEACWTGDNAQIEQLCLPKVVSESQPPIQISVQTIWTKSWLGVSPLAVALERRHWQTARLILAIASAQYKPDNNVEHFNVDDLTGDYDNGSDASGDDDDENREVIFSDVAERPSVVQCKAPPSKMLQSASGMWMTNGKLTSGTPMQRAIIEDDFEAFINICDLYKELGVELWPTGNTLSFIMQHDRPEMLEELIRRTGVGISVPADLQQTESERTSASKVDEHVYLGLNIQGKKRKDLATRRHAPKPTLRFFPLLQEAAKSGASKIIDYLATSRPLAAFRYYASSHSDACAHHLRRTTDLETQLPKWLGWEINELNESCLTTAVTNDKFEVVKQLFDLQPKMMTEAMNAQINFIRVNAVCLAVYMASKEEMIDFFLEKGCDPTGRDVRGWNIFHLAVISGNNNRRTIVLEHLLRKLPKDMSAILLEQQSKDALNTPLMLAVKEKRAVTVRFLVEFGLDTSVYILKDAGGSTPLHIAVQHGDVATVRLLLQHGPPESLYVENCVGQTAFDIAGQRRLTKLLGTNSGSFGYGGGRQRGHIGNLIHPPALMQHTSVSVTAQDNPFILYVQEERLPKLRETLNDLLRDGQLKKGTKLATMLLEFADAMEARLAAAKAAMVTAKVADFPRREFDNLNVQDKPSEVWDLVREAAAGNTVGQRHLVHLIDVQKSVNRHLKGLQSRVDIHTAFTAKMQESDGFAPERVVDQNAQADQGPLRIVNFFGPDNH
ncbi:hypothetical protein EWM64_g7248 [Hericium alpestre]|uniref:Ankyrin repeat protein n=1 Tax=Hericium alpestre TaxID=135208 RepID=A0A4Y9ZR77_9AGAM|nr:hypothetical protein EWM64_g7248 [Hericium alpestre]